MCVNSLQIWAIWLWFCLSKGWWYPTTQQIFAVFFVRIATGRPDSPKKIIPNRSLWICVMLTNHRIHHPKIYHIYEIYGWSVTLLYKRYTHLQMLVIFVDLICWLFMGERIEPPCSRPGLKVSKGKRPGPPAAINRCLWMGDVYATGPETVLVKSTFF